jgi:glycosyltransferase involved in cell wall biosynthesis
VRSLILEPAGNLYGSERVLLDFLTAARGLASWNIAVCCPPRTPLLPYLSDLGVRVFPYFAANLHTRGRIARATALAGLVAAMTRFRPDVLYVNQAGATRIALAAGRLFRVPVVTHVRLVEDVDYLSQLTERADLRIAVCISTFIRGLFNSATAPEDLVTLYDPYQPKTVWAAAGSAPQGIATLACVGRLCQVKGQDLLVGALAALGRVGVHARALFLGAPPPGDSFDVELRALATSLGLDDRIEWAGFQESVLDRLRLTDVLVCPSRVEPLGRVIFEGWDAGVVPVGFAGSGGTAEVINASGGGILFDRPDADSLADALRRALALSRLEREAMVARGRQWLREHCDPKRFAAELTAVWQRAAQ